MFAILGAAGKIGFTTSKALRDAGMPVRAILRDETKAASLRDIGCEIKIADLQDTEALVMAFRGAETIQIILPPSPELADPVEEMHKTIERLGTALEKAGPKRVLAISDYGAHITKDIGMPTIFHALEERLAQVKGQKLFLRSAEHMQNWGRILPAAIETGVLPTFHSSAHYLLPTISAPDVGQIAANILLRPIDAERDSVDVFHAEASQRYSINHVALAVSKLTGRAISVNIVPRAQWKTSLEKAVGHRLAELFIKTNEAHNDGGMIDIEPDSGTVIHGSTTLAEALITLLPTKAKSN